MKKHLLVLLLIVFVQIINAQTLTNLFEKEIEFVSDTITFNATGVVPGSLEVYFQNKLISSDRYIVNYAEATLLFKRTALLPERAMLKIKYRVFLFNFYSSYFHKNINLSEENVGKSIKKRYIPDDEQESFLSNSQLTKAGSFSRGINFGNNQDVSVNSNFNLQLSGKISSDVSISANISDNNIPVQSDGTSQYLREFDKVFIELSSENSKLTVGDFEIIKPAGYFMNFHKKVQGAGFYTNIVTKKNHTVETTLNTAVSKGNFNRQKIIAVEGNQGPYKLDGTNNEMYVVVLSGSEKIYIDGELLSRGFENDYIIDYNSAELTFTANRPITKDTRIIAEFEYSELSYAEFIISSETKIKRKNSMFYINLFSDQDAKNQNLRQDLTVEQKYLLSNIGDNLSEAVVYNISKIDTFNSNEILYRKTDTVVNAATFEDIYVFSADSIPANYRIGFSYVGENSGYYTRIQSGANGRVYEWVAPENGILQGSYEPVKVLVSPKKKQMLSAGGNFTIKKAVLNFETAITNNDINTFSAKGDEDNLGYAFKLGIRKNLLKKDTGVVKLNFGADYYFTHKNFNAFEPFKSTEFERDWNLPSLYGTNNESVLNFFLEYKKKDFGKLGLYTDILDRKNNYSGNKNKIFVDVNKKKLSFFADVNRLTATDTAHKSEFVRYDFKLERKGKNLTVGLRNSGEKNVFYSLGNNNLSLTSFRYNQPEIFIKASAKVNAPITLSYSSREDFLPRESGLNLNSKSRDYKFSGVIFKTSSQRLKTNITYRTLHFADSSTNKKSEEKTLTGRLEHSIKIYKGAISSSFFLEHVSGNELVREFSYIEVQNGQGIFTWEDFNGNSIKELNEFVKANFQDEADYIRVSLPTNQYRRVYNQSLNIVFGVNPRRIWFKERGVKKLLSNFSNKFAYKHNRKINNNSSYYSIQLPDSGLLSLTSRLNNNLRLNIKPTKTILNLIYTLNESKLLLINGVDARTNSFYNFAISQKFETFIFSDVLKKGQKTYSSEFFEENNYNINYISNLATATYRVNKKTDLSANFSIKNKNNISGEENANFYSVGSEYKASGQNQGTLMLKFDFVNIKFSGTTNTPVSYEMLDGLMPGKNYIWSAGWYKKITKYLQLELNYSGRKSEENKIIHSGGLSVRAVF
ncbi:MAG: hypothetical protein L3J35_10650 [Bacteroidales bacterium]|nr:hypothetical protein [Bacteroidales bacterium]